MPSPTSGTLAHARSTLDALEEAPPSPSQKHDAPDDGHEGGTLSASSREPSSMYSRMCGLRLLARLAKAEKYQISSSSARSLSSKALSKSCNLLAHVSSTSSKPEELLEPVPPKTSSASPGSASSRSWPRAPLGMPKMFAKSSTWFGPPSRARPGSIFLFVSLPLPPTLELLELPPASGRPPVAGSAAAGVADKAGRGSMPSNAAMSCTECLTSWHCFPQSDRRPANSVHLTRRSPASSSMNSKPENFISKLDGKSNKGCS
mmetsp:Transcript_93047/g.242631  ORF Transcript_93047/g.242631 Transcript_93047/m.242631 type:complete len:261 (+) Transcript_93047:350-1132(+)